MGYIAVYKSTSDWIDDVIDYVLDDPTPLMPVINDRYIIASHGNSLITAVDNVGGVFTVAPDVTLDVAINDIIRVRQGANEGWYTVSNVVWTGVATEITVVEAVPSAVVAGYIHWSVTGSDWGYIGVDRVTTYNGVNWVLNYTPTSGTSCYETTGAQFIMFSGTAWYPFGVGVDHTTLVNLVLGDAGHTQFAMLDGRAGGQTIIGGTGAGDALILQSETAGGGNIELNNLLDVRITLGDAAGANSLYIDDSAHHTVFSVDSDGIISGTDCDLIDTGIVHFGDRTTNGSWRMVRSGNDLVVERREAGAWVTKGIFAP